jgi:signal transduction histidine kinase
MSAERILVVDDDDALLNLMSLALRRRGYQVELAGNGPKAIEILTSQPPFSVMVTDMVMPGMTGLELLRHARKIDELLEVIIVTAVPDLDSAISAMRADGAYDYLIKPFESMNQLVMAVERAASHRRLIIEREQLREKVQREAERLRALIMHTGEAVLSADSEGVLQIVNPAAAKLLCDDHLEGTNALSSLPPALGNLISNWQAVGSNLPAVIEMPWANGTIQMISLAPVPEEGIEHWGWVAIIRDITHIKKMDELKSQLLVDVASKVRAPLTQAMNNVVELNILTAQNAQVSEVVSRLSQTWKRIQEWSDDLNALIRVDSEFVPEPAQIQVSKILEDIQHTYNEHVLKNSAIHLDVTIEPALPPVTADPELIQRLLSNLVNRAVHRSQDSGTIQLTARFHNDQVWISISDDGPAVEETDLPHIFEMSFIKANPTPGVTGLEMALVKTFIDRMGGQIWIGNQGNKGSSVIVCLPSAVQ